MQDTAGEYWIKLSQWINGAALRVVSNGYLGVYCRNDGNDDNDGLEDNAEHAFRTVQGAMERVTALYTNNFLGININCTTNGEFSRSASEPLLMYRNININCFDGTITVAGVYASQNGNSGNYLKCDTINITAAGRDGAAFHAENISFLGLSANTINIKSDVTYLFLSQNPGAGMWVSGLSVDKLTVNCENHKISIMFNVNSQTFMYIDGVIIKNCNITNVTAQARYLGFIGFTSLGAQFSGVTSTKRYQILYNGVINTSGGGANYLPGTAAGTVSTGGVYA